MTHNMPVNKTIGRTNWLNNADLMTYDIPMKRTKRPPAQFNNLDQAYGFRDDEFFILKLYSLHEKTYALTG